MWPQDPGNGHRRAGDTLLRCDPVQNGDLAAINRENKSERPVFVAARNVHRAFVYASAELDADVVWLTSKDNLSLCSCKISAEDLKETLSKQKVKPAAVYITSPDYLGNTADIAALSQIAHSYGVPLLCDNAHGAYLHFLREKCHITRDRKSVV